MAAFLKKKIYILPQFSKHIFFLKRTQLFILTVARIKGFPRKKK